MHLIPSPRLVALSMAICSLVTAVVGETKGINCDGKGCGWDCTDKCSQDFSNTIAQLNDTEVLTDGQQLACMYDIMAGNGMCAYIYGMGPATTTGANIKLVAQDLANHCGSCGSAPVNRSNGNSLKDGWLQIQSVGTGPINQCNLSGATTFDLCQSSCTNQWGCVTN